MDRLIIETSDSPEITITQINGTLRMKGWDRPQIRADMELEDTLKAETDGNTVTISCTSGCLLRVPNDSMIEIDKIMNELVIKSIDGCISVKKVHGQVMVKSIGKFSVENAYSNLNAKHIESDLKCGKIAGQANIQDVDGQITLKQVSGNLSVRGYSAGLIANTNGNANLRLEPEPDGEYRITANGNITYRLEPFTNATISMKARGGKIRVNIPGVKDVLSSKEDQIVVGEGDSKVTLEASGNIEVTQRDESRSEREYDFDYEDLSELSTLADDISQMVTDQIETQMDSISQHIHDLTSNLSNIDVHASERTRRKLEAKRRTLEHKLASAERKAIRKARIAERRIGQKLRVRGQKPPSHPVSDEERQKVLEMLQNQQISVAEAEVLLAALEGQAPASPEAAPGQVEIEHVEAETDEPQETEE
jgi:DUF4097 and DUF4098 domain-containing protein YvlB